MKAELRALAAGPYIEGWQKQAGAQTSPSITRRFLVDDHGARGDGTTLSTVFIQKTIDAAAAAGGGVVEFSPGRYVTGSLFIKSNVHLHVGKDVVLLGAEADEAWPMIFTRAAGVEMQWRAALFNVRDQENVSITGEGVVDARGKRWWDRFWNSLPEAEKQGIRWAIDFDIARPHLIQIHESQNVTVRGLTLHNSPFWTIDVVYSKYVTVDGVTIRNNLAGEGPSTDGINIDSSAFVAVRNCDVDCNDDCYCFKAGMNADGFRVNLPAQYSLFEHNIARRGHGGITLGSDMSGGIRYVEATGLRCYGTDTGIRFKSAKIRGGEVRDVLIQGVQMEQVGVAFLASLNWFPKYSYPEIPEGRTDVPAHWHVLVEKIPADKAIPWFHDITIRDVNATGSETAFDVEGLSEKPLENIRLENIQISAKKAGRIVHAKNWSFHGLRMDAADERPVSVEHSTDVAC